MESSILSEGHNTSILRTEFSVAPSPILSACYPASRLTTPRAAGPERSDFVLLRRGDVSNRRKATVANRDREWRKWAGKPTLPLSAVSALSRSSSRCDSTAGVDVRGVVAARDERG